jgi:hypothetical protein
MPQLSWGDQKDRWSYLEIYRHGHEVLEQAIVPLQDDALTKDILFLWAHVSLAMYEAHHAGIVLPIDVPWVGDRGALDALSMHPEISMESRAKIRYCLSEMATLVQVLRLGFNGAIVHEYWNNGYVKNQNLLHSKVLDYRSTDLNSDF